MKTKLSEVIPHIDEASLDGAHWPTVTRAIGHLFKDAAVYLCQDSIRRFGTFDIWTRGFDPTVWNRQALNYGEWDPAENHAVRAVMALPKKVTVDRRQIISERIWGDDPYVKALFSDQDLSHAAVSMLRREDEIYDSLCIARRSSAEAFDTSEREAAAELASHLRRGLKTYQALKRERARSRSLADALDRLGGGVVLLDATLTVFFANAAAERALGECLGLAMRGGRLAAAATPEQQRLEEEVRRLSGSAMAAEANVAFTAADGRPGLSLRLVRLVGAAHFDVRARASVVAFIANPHDPPPEPTVQGMRALGLTAAEARIAILAARALRPRDVANALGMSENTVKTHLKGVFFKLGVSSQAELVRWMLLHATR